jgi:hypothetical protein
VLSPTQQRTHQEEAGVVVAGTHWLLLLLSVYSPTLLLCPTRNRYRELGCHATAVRIQVPSEGPNDTETTSSYNITLLAAGDKNLAQSFPRPKVLKQKQGR